MEIAYLWISAFVSCLIGFSFGAYWMRKTERFGGYLILRETECDDETYTALVLDLSKHIDVEHLDQYKTLTFKVSKEENNEYSRSKISL